MRKILRIFTTFLMLFASVVFANAQSTATATVSVDIINPVSMEASVEEAILTNDADDESIKIFPLQSSQKSFKSSFNLPLVRKTIVFAKVQINDVASSHFDVTLPTTITISNMAKTGSLTAYSFQQQRKARDGGKRNGQLYLSAEVAMSTQQAKGVYTSRPVDVTVNYN